MGSASRYTVLLGCFVVFRAAFVQAAPGDLLFKIPFPDEVELTIPHFGEEIIVAGDDLFISASGMSVDGWVFVGSTYLFDGTDGTLLRRIPFPEQLENTISFGHSLAFADDKFFVLAPNIIRSGILGRGSGAIYVFDKRGDLLFVVDKPDEPGTSFKRNLAVSHNDVLVADPAQGVDGVRGAGIVFLVDASTGAIRTIANPDPESNDSFGNGQSALAAFDNQIVVGNPLERDPESPVAHGSVFVIDRDTGETTVRLDNPEPTSSDSPQLSDDFGNSLATIGQKVAVGAKLQDVGGVLNAGSVYLFDGYSGDLLLTIPNPESGERDEFGTHIAAYGDDILIGAPRDWVDGLEAAGTVYLYDGETGEQLLEIVNPEPTTWAVFGQSVVALGDRIVVGAPQADVNGVPAGAVYVFEGIPEPSGAQLLMASVLMAPFLRSGFRPRMNRHASRSNTAISSPDGRATST